MRGNFAGEFHVIFGAETTGWVQGLAKRVVYARDFYMELLGQVC